MDSKALLKEITMLPGASGYEHAAANRLADAFRELGCDTRIDAYQNVIGHISGEGSGPSVAIFAHIDEIGLMISGIEPNGFLRFVNIGGIDVKVLPSMEVIVHGKEKLFGVIGAKPPHVLTPAEMKEAVGMNKMAIDVGLPKEEVEKLVSIGDIATFRDTPVDLLNGLIAGKTMDDRACAMILVELAQRLASRRFSGDVYLVGTCQEEVGCKGALMASSGLNPDIAIAIDVCHADMRGAKKTDTVPIEKLAIAKGTILHNKLTDRLIETAKANNIPHSINIAPRGRTGTDADSLHSANAGLPTCLIEIPLKYMHTTVETISFSTIVDSGRLIAEFITGLGEGWEELLCF